MFQQISRTNPSTGKMERPWRDRDHQFILGDPSEGSQRHLTNDHAVRVDNYGEALELVQRGFAIRMSDGRSAPSLVVPRSLTISDDPVERIDDLWTYTMPVEAFSRDDLEKDIRGALTSMAVDTYWIAGPQAAEAFAGADFDIDDAEWLESRLDLTRFNFARVVFAAYESAFRVGEAHLIPDEDIDELEVLIGAMIGAPFRRYPNPVDHRDSPLRRVMLSAYLRWQISEFGGFDNDKLNQSAVEKLAVLAGMTDQAVRNSLNKEGLSAKGEMHYPSIIRWLENRRDFVPFREDERPGARSTWTAIHLLKTMPPREAFSEIRKRAAESARVEVIEREIMAVLDQANAPSPALLRQYAREAGLLIDTFVLNFPGASAAASAAAA